MGGIFGILSKSNENNSIISDNSENSEYNEISEMSIDSEDGCYYDTANKVYLRDLFKLPEYIRDRMYESRDQFITLKTEDGVKMLHIYHYNRFMANKDNQKKLPKSEFRRLFCDPKTGWSYCYGRDRIYRKYIKVL